MGQGQGRELPFDVGEKFSSLSGRSIWSMHAGKRKGDGESVSVFVFDFSGKSEDEIKLARSAHLRLKTLRHPNVLRYIDGIELPTCIYVVTEEAVPLEERLTTQEGYSQFSTTWGLHQIIKAISFLTTDCGLVHRNVCLSSVFVDSAGEWKLGGVEFMHQFGDTPPPKSLESLRRYDPPETGKPSAARRVEKWSTDMWGLGCLVWEVFNGPLPQVSALRNTNKIPKPLVSHYCELVSANPRSRPNPSVLLSSLREHGGYLANQFVSIALRIEELQIMEPSQRNDFFTELNKALDSFPESFAKRKILPQLLTAFEFGGAGSAVLAPLFRLGKLLDGVEYQKKIVPCVVKLFSSTDRATRLNLLQQLEHFIDHLQPSTVNDQIFPHVANGFTDTIPALREQTIKSMLLIAPKLSQSTLNSQLLKYFAKCQLDEQPGIRANTTVCLGKIACHLNPLTRQKVLVSAFLRSLKDPFPPARCAGIGAMAATHSYFTTSDVATRLLPALCTITVDKEKTVRDQAFQVIKLFLGKLERFSEDPLAAEQQQKIEASTTSWTGWAVSSLTSFYKTTPSHPPPPPSTSSQQQGVKREEKKGPQREERKGTPERSARRESPAVQKEEEEEKGEEVAEGWDDKEWEDFTMPSGDIREQERGGVGEGKEEGSDLEGWEDDGWDTFETPSVTTSLEKDKPALSSGADFFDTFPGSVSTNRSKNEDFFESFGASSTTGRGRREKERSPPPPVAASLFGVTKTEEKGDDGGWGDWGEDFSFPSAASKQEKKKAAAPIQSSGALKLGSKSTKKDPPLFTMGAEGASSSKPTPADSREGEGWDFGSDWGSFEPLEPQNTQKQAGSTGTDGRNKQELLQKRREERRLKQQAAREKRAAGVTLKPSSLGAVKKE